MRTVFLAVSFLFLVIGSEVQAQDTLSQGSLAIDFALPYATKDSISKSLVRLSDFLDKRPVVLAFYPADWSTGCTKELCAMRDNFESLQALDAEVLAISGDYLWSHHEWAKSLNLPFKLLSDHPHTVAKLYNSYNDTTMYNRRTVFVVDKRGRIIYSNMQYNVRDLKDFEKLKSALAGAQ